MEPEKTQILTTEHTEYTEGIIQERMERIVFSFFRVFRVFRGDVLFGCGEGALGIPWLIRLYLIIRSISIMGKWPKLTSNATLRPVAFK